MRGIKYAPLILFLLCLCFLGACAPFPGTDSAAVKPANSSPIIFTTHTNTGTQKKIPILRLKGTDCYDQQTRLDRCQISKEITPTLERIKRGEKYPHRNDGTVFSNREGILPKQANSSYYHEYVVPTPNQNGPGARRLVLGAKSEIYYSRDHYASYIQVIV